MRTRVSQGFALLSATLLLACQKPEPLTAAKAEQILRSYMFQREPVYAEVPQRVWWNAQNPKDDFDEKSLRTFQHLEKAGLITVVNTSSGDTTSYTAMLRAPIPTCDVRETFPVRASRRETVRSSMLATQTEPEPTATADGLLPTAIVCTTVPVPGSIRDKVYDGIRNFQRHPTQPTVGHAELIWHYDDPTPLYPLFETKMNKPLKKPFASLVSFYYKDHQWHFDVTVPKAEVTSGGPERSTRRSPQTSRRFATGAPRFSRVGPASS